MIHFAVFGLIFGLFFFASIEYGKELKMTAPRYLAAVTVLAMVTQGFGTSLVYIIYYVIEKLGA